MTHRTRVKICGLSRIEDVQAVVAAGADAIGLNFYEKSARYVAPEQAARLAKAVPPFVTTVGLFVNSSVQQIADIVAQVPISVLQFHGDETMEQCHAVAKLVNRQFIRVIRVKPGMTGADLLKYDHDYRAAGALCAGLLLDAWVDEYGGAGKGFDWSLIPEELAPRVVLSGGLSVQNATDAVQRVRPYAVDVSSGVELQKGVKDAAMIRAFVDTVRKADAAS